MLTTRCCLPCSFKPGEDAEIKYEDGKKATIPGKLSVQCLMMDEAALQTYDNLIKVCDSCILFFLLPICLLLFLFSHHIVVEQLERACHLAQLASTVLERCYLHVRFLDFSRLQSFQIVANLYP